MLSPETKRVYAQRTKSLRKLGFTSYDDYLKSSLWQVIRRKILLPGTRCIACGKAATQVHHSRYAPQDLDGSQRTHLHPVCQGCHVQAEFTQEGWKNTPRQATEKLAARAVSIAKRQKTDAWSAFFRAVAAARGYLGMDPSEEARLLVEHIDIAQAALTGSHQKKQN